MGILQLISTSNFITVNKDLIKELGLKEAILLGELASEYDYWNNKNEIEDGYFYSTIENIEEKTTLTAYKQRKCLENLKNKEIIDIQIRGIPAKRYIKINEEQVIEIFNNKLLKNLITGCKKTSQLEVKKLNGNNNIINNNIINNNINKNIKKEKKEKKETEFDSVINENFTDEELKQTIYEFIKMRKAIKKPLTTRGLELMIKKLYNLSTNITEQIEILNNSIMNNWQGIFPLKKEIKQSNKKGSFDDFKQLWEEARIEDEQKGNNTDNNIFGG